MGKNIQRLQNIVDGNYERKIQSGYEKAEVTRKIGDKWTDSDGVEWEQKKGYISKINRTPGLGIANNCSDCDKFIFNKWDKDIHKANGRCYYCQIDFEAKMKDYPIKWFAWRRLKDLQNMESVERDLEQWVDEQTKLRKINPLDEKVANALANANVDTTIKMHKNKL